MRKKGKTEGIKCHLSREEGKKFSLFLFCTLRLRSGYVVAPERSRRAFDGACVVEHNDCVYPLAKSKALRTTASVGRADSAATVGARRD